MFSEEETDGLNVTIESTDDGSLYVVCSNSPKNGERECTCGKKCYLLNELVKLVQVHEADNIRGNISYQNCPSITTTTTSATDRNSTTQANTSHVNRS